MKISLSPKTPRSMYHMLVFHPNKKSWLRPPVKSCIRLSGCSKLNFDLKNWFLKSLKTPRNMYYMLVFHPNEKSWLRPPLKSCIRLSGCSSNRFSHYLQYFLSTGVRNVHICIRIVVQKAYCAHTYCVRKSREGAKNRHSGATKKSFLTNFRTFAHLELDIC